MDLIKRSEVLADIRKHIISARKKGEEEFAQILLTIRREFIKIRSEHPYELAEDGTLAITVPKGTEISRVLIQERGTHNGSLFYPEK